jgi:hypothetical protein
LAWVEYDFVISGSALLTSKSLMGTVDGEEVVLRLTEHAVIADLAAVLQLCAAGRLRCSEKTRRPSAATVEAVGQVLAAGDFYGGEPIAAQRRGWRPAASSSKT